MEDRIKEILRYNLANHVSIDKRIQVAQEITSHIIEFVEWLISMNVEGFIIDHFDKEPTVAEIYQYWLNNVKK